ncbi:MAG: argininosuccinate lyase [Bdellovibrionales bacterium]
MKKLWGGRFEKETDKRVEDFTASLSYDQRLKNVDIRASQAHARMLGKVGVLSAAEAAEIVNGLEYVQAGLEKGDLWFNPEGEDIHSEIERLLSEKVGAVAGKLHTARSRNDQVATDIRLYLRGEIDDLSQEILKLQTWLKTAAQNHTATLLPGLTHTQHAQPVSLAHHLMAYFWMFQRDRDRLNDLRKRVNRLPLGSAALAGTGFALDRDMVAAELGFDGICENSLDAVSDRDFIVEFLSAASLLMMHLSRQAEELILWSTPEFGFVTLDDSVTTGSSIMPQKKNPDVAELIRGRVGRVYGQLMASLTMLKALPLAYNRDLQEDKIQLFDAIDVVGPAVGLMRLMFETATFNQERMSESLKGDFSNATDLADFLVQKGQTFREAHHVIGRIVRYCLAKKIALESITLDELKTFSPLFTMEALHLLPHQAVMEARISKGGTSTQSVLAQIKQAEGLL